MAQLVAQTATQVLPWSLGGDNDTGLAVVLQRALDAALLHPAVARCVAVLLASEALKRSRGGTQPAEVHLRMKELRHIFQLAGPGARRERHHKEWQWHPLPFNGIKPGHNSDRLGLGQNVGAGQQLLLHLVGRVALQPDEHLLQVPLLLRRECKVRHIHRGQRVQHCGPGLGRPGFHHHPPVGHTGEEEGSGCRQLMSTSESRVHLTHAHGHIYGGHVLFCLALLTIAHLHRILVHSEGRVSVTRSR